MRLTVYDSSDHQSEQIEVINQIEEQIKSDALTFSTVEPVKDYENDPRICLTGIHFPRQELVDNIRTQIIDPLQAISPEHYYYPDNSLHTTIKSVRVINNPSRFTETDIEKARQVFSGVIPLHKKFDVYFYRLLLFPHNLALIGTTDEELDNIILDLDKKLIAAGIPDDKTYSNSKYFFSNMTLARFSNAVSDEFKQKVEDLSKSLSFEPYTVDSVTLLTCNAIGEKKKNIGVWQLR